jgi:hypothetical protein
MFPIRGWLLALAFGLACGGAQPVGRGPGPPAGGQGEAAYRLDLGTREVAQTVEAVDSAGAGRRFVRIEVAEVRNPKQYPVSFLVRYRDRDGTTTDLGSFALFPPDNPGSFIVPTKDRVRPGGSLVLSLVVPHEAGAGDTVQTVVKRLRLVND